MKGAELLLFFVVPNKVPQEQFSTKQAFCKTIKKRRSDLLVDESGLSAGSAAAAGSPEQQARPSAG